MAGRGSRFADAGYDYPKPLIPVGGKPMIQWVIENVRPLIPHRFVFVCLADHLTKYPAVAATLRHLCPGCEIVKVENITEGAACTVLLARALIDSEDPLMIANADQFVEVGIDDYLTEGCVKHADGLIMTFWSNHPKWSYCRLNIAGYVEEVVEKKVVSNEATVGIYNFSRGSDFVRAAMKMIEKDLRVNGEFYVAPVYNELIAEGLKVVVSNTGREYNGMFGLGVPEDLEFFKTTPHFDSKPQRSSDPSLLKIAAFSELFVAFVQSKNQAGLSALAGFQVPFITCEGIQNTPKTLKDLCTCRIVKLELAGISRASNGLFRTVVSNVGPGGGVMEIEWTGQTLTGIKLKGDSFR